MGLGAGAASASICVGAEVCAPLMLLCWLCCWSDDTNSDTSSNGKHPQKPMVSNENSRRRRSSEIFGKKLGVGSSAVSLHLPSTSGVKMPLSAHRSHEEIRAARKSNVEIQDPETKYHSAPSVIDEIIHRRDWDRSTKDLYIPLKSPGTDFPESSKATIENNETVRFETSCKKHHTNIKSSKVKEYKESNSDDVKDEDETETNANDSKLNFYIGDDNGKDLKDNTVIREKGKEVKQSLNESIKRAPRLQPLDEHKIASLFGVEELEDIDRSRSGATNHSQESRSSAMTCISRLTMVPYAELDTPVGEAYLASNPESGVITVRGRHASTGDILGPAPRPQSGAFSESDLYDYDLELLDCDDPPPPYNDLQNYNITTTGKETAI